MATADATEFTVAWFDLSTHCHAFASILRWCDTAQARLFPADADSSAAMKELHAVWATGAVMRSNVVFMQMPHETLQACSRVRVRPFITAVGRTSWTCGFHVTTAGDAGDAPRAVALVETTMVNTNAAHTESIAVPHREVLASMVVGDCDFTRIGRPTFAERGPAPNNVFRFDMPTRKTDCDSLGHINNAVYGSLGEEARCHAAFHGAFSNDATAKRMANKAGAICRISYIGQAHPFDILNVSIWAEPSDTYERYNWAPGRCFRVDFRKGSEMITRMSITVFDEKRGGGAAAAATVAEAAL